MSQDILIIDDEKDIRELISGILTDEGYITTTADGVVQAIESIKKQNPHLIILDVWLGDSAQDGLRLLSIIKKEYQHIPVIMMSGHGTIDTAVQAIKDGAYDFIEKPFDSNRLLTSIQKTLEVTKLKKENKELKIKTCHFDSLIGESPNIRMVKQTIEKIAPLNGQCIIIGAAGTDKEAIAREIHNNSPRAQNQLEIINCNAFSPQQFETAFFGLQIKGERENTIIQGCLEKSHGGTLFINNINSVSFYMQLKILKMLKEKSFVRIGGINYLNPNVRIIAGATPNIKQQVLKNSFHEELFYRLGIYIIQIEPLHSRKSDIPLLLNHFMNQTAKAYSILPKKFSPEVMGILLAYSWPGDVLQMRNLVDLILIKHIAIEKENIITLEDLPIEIIENKTTTNTNNMQFISKVSEMSLKQAREIFEREYFIEQLKKFSWNISKTAKFVGMERSAFHRKLKSLNISHS